MFWPQDHIFNFFKQFMLFNWFITLISLTFSIYYTQQPNSFNCANQTDAQLLNTFMCESLLNKDKEFTVSKEQCYTNLLNHFLNCAIVLSILISWFKIRLLRKWFSFDYLLNVICLVAFHGWIYLNELEFIFTNHYYVYLGLIAFQCLISIIFEYNYYNRYLTYDFILGDPMFDPKIITYSSIKIVYMCGYLISHKYPQSKCAAIAYQLYKYILICVSNLTNILLIWYFVSLDCNHLIYGERIILLISIILMFVLTICWRKDVNSSKITYIFLAIIGTFLILNLLQKAINVDQFYNLSNYLAVLIGIMITSLLAFKFCKSFKEHRAYSELYDKEFRKLLIQVYDQCRNKEYFMIKYNFKIKYKCCICGSLAIDLVCNECYGVIFNPKKR